MEARLVLTRWRILCVVAFAVGGLAGCDTPPGDPSKAALPVAVTAPLPELPVEPLPKAADPTPPEIRAKQKSYLEAWREAEQGEWSKLPPEQREEARAALKNKIFAQ